MATEHTCPHGGLKPPRAGFVRVGNWLCGRDGWLCPACREDRADVRALAAAMITGSAGYVIKDFLSAYAKGPDNGSVAERAVKLAAILRVKREGGE